MMLNRFINLSVKTTGGLNIRGVYSMNILSLMIRSSINPPLYLWGAETTNISDLTGVSRGAFSAHLYDVNPHYRDVGCLILYFCPVGNLTFIQSHKSSKTPSYGLQWFHISSHHWDDIHSFMWSVCCVWSCLQVTKDCWTSNSFLLMLVPSGFVSVFVSIEEVPSVVLRRN